MNSSEMFRRIEIVQTTRALYFKYKETHRHGRLVKD